MMYFKPISIGVLVVAMGCATTPEFVLPSDQMVQTIDRGDARSAIAHVSNYKFGDSRSKLVAVEEIVRRSLYNPNDQIMVAAMLAGELDGRGTLESKRFLCRQLAIVGTPNEIPMLARALHQPRLSDMARYALQPISHPDVDRALVAALDDTSPKIQVGIINSLAERKAYGALGALRALRGSPSPDVARAAKHAVGRIEGRILP